jgi:hypothetical protein
MRKPWSSRRVNWWSTAVPISKDKAPLVSARSRAAAFASKQPVAALPAMSST